MTPYVLEAVNISIHFPIKRNIFGKAAEVVRAVDNVSLRISEGDSVGIVGESGSGKTTLARCLVGLIKPTSGSVLFRGVDIFSLRNRAYKDYRRKVQMVFQNPLASLNPMMRVRDLLKDVLKAAGKWVGVEEGEKGLRDLVASVGLREDILDKYAVELSGGQAQRVAIARALATDPEVLVLDEPTSALDVSVQAQILELLKSLKNERMLTYVFITHDIAAARYMATRLVVMYRGKIVEEGPTDEVIENPRNQYTRTLIGNLMKLYTYIEGINS